MGTTLTQAAYVGANEVFIAHVGDSRAYRWRDGRLDRITEDHSLVEELVRQGRLTEEEAEEHPQRSIITRALGPEPGRRGRRASRSARGRRGPSTSCAADGLTSMMGEPAIAEMHAQRAGPGSSAAEQLVDRRAGRPAGATTSRSSSSASRRWRATAPTMSAATEELAAVAADVLAPTEEVSVPGERADHGADPGRRPPSSGRGRAQGRSTAPAARTARRARRAPRPPGPRPPSRRAATAAGGGCVLAGLLIGAVVAILVIAGLLAVAVDLLHQPRTPTGQVGSVYNGIRRTRSRAGCASTRSSSSPASPCRRDLEASSERRRFFNDELRSQAGATQLVAQLPSVEELGQTM